MKFIQPSMPQGDDNIAIVTTYMGATSLQGFAWGFLELAEMATDRMIANTCGIDVVAPAVLYSFRHSIELFLKSALYELKVVDENVPIHGHRVDVILDDHAEMMRHAIEHEFQWNGDRRAWFRRLEELVRAIADFDPDGQSIRYPADRSLKANQGGEVAISTRRLRDCLRKTRDLYSEFVERDS